MDAVQNASVPLIKPYEYAVLPGEEIEDGAEPALRSPSASATTAAPGTLTETHEDTCPLL